MSTPTSVPGTPIAGLQHRRRPVILGALAGSALTVVPVLAVALVGMAAGGSTSDKIVLTLINVAFALGLQVFTGNTGVVSFSPLVFAAIGGYVGGILAMPAAQRARLDGLPDVIATLPAQSLAVCLVAGGLAALVAALVTSVIPYRLQGAAAVVATLALLLAVNSVLVGWADVTRGAGGLTPLPKLTSLPIVLVVVVLMIVVARWFRDSAVGLQLRASKSDRVAAEASGVRVRGLRVVAWSLSSTLLGMAGVLLALQLTSITPNTFYLAATFVIVAMVIVGGQASPSGAVLGALLVSGVQFLLRPLETVPFSLGDFSIDGFTGITQLSVVALLLAAMYLRPGGLLGNREVDELIGAMRLRRLRSGRAS